MEGVALDQHSRGKGRKGKERKGRNAIMLGNKILSQNQFCP